MKIVDKYRFDQTHFHVVNNSSPVLTQSSRSKQFTSKQSSCILSNVMKMSANQINEQYNLLLHEITVLKNLDHVRILRCHKILKTPTNLYLIFDDLRGRTLEEVLQEKLELNLAIKIIGEIIQSLAYLGLSNICHAHLCLHYIKLLENQHIKVINFQRALQFGKIVPKCEASSSEFAAPEVKTGQPVTPLTDIYSLGLIIKAILGRIKQDQSRLISSRSRSEICGEVERILEFTEGMLKQKPEQRLQISQINAYFKNRKYCESMPSLKSDGDKKYKRTKSVNDLVSPVNPNINKSNTIKYAQQPALSLKNNSPKGFSGKQEIYLAEWRKVKHKRNLAILFLQLGELSTQLPFANTKAALSSAFLFIKKAALVLAQIAKFLDKGRSQSMVMPSRTFAELINHKGFRSMQTILSKQMKLVSQKFNAVVTIMQSQNLFDEDKMLKYELTRQSVDYVFERHAVGDLLKQMKMWRQKQQKNTQQLLAEDTFHLLQQQQLCLLFVMGMLTEFPCLEDIYDTMFKEQSCDLWDSPFLAQMMEIEREILCKMILNQSDITSQRKKQGNDSRKKQGHESRHR